MSDVRRLEAEKRRRLESENKDEPQTERLPAQSSQPSESYQPTESSQPTEQPHGSPESSQPTLSSQPGVSHQQTSPLNILASLPDIKGDARVPHRYTDHLCRLLNPYEQAVYLQLYRLSWGWGKETCFISNPRLSERSNVPLSTMKRVVVALVDKGLIEKTGHTNGFGKDQGVEYRVLSVSWQPAQSSQPTSSSQPATGPNKIKNTQKNTHTQELGDEAEKEGRAPRGVRVSSKFSIEECRRYAQHLQSTGQGINNPGGYATTIHRTGEADELIERFLNPTASTQVDASQCLDCKGSGFYYPNGPGGGVAKCKHERLTAGVNMATSD
jgi:hypothetical protein